MKLAETDGHFWNLVGNMLYHEDNVVEWSYNKDTRFVTITSPGEKTKVTIDSLNEMLEKKKDFIKANWRTGNNFDGKLEVDQ